MPVVFCKVRKTIERITNTAVMLLGAFFSIPLYIVCRRHGCSADRWLSLTQRALWVGKGGGGGRSGTHGRFDKDRTSK